MGQKNGTHKFRQHGKISNKGDVRNILNIIKPQDPVCKHCQHGKQTKVNFKTKEHSTSKPLEIVHTNLCGPIRAKIL